MHVELLSRSVRQETWHNKKYNKKVQFHKDRILQVNAHDITVHLLEKFNEQLPNGVQ